jgi:hypothetical protein
MLYYPQLPSGASCQFPIQKRSTQRTIVNDCQDGREIRLADSGAASVEWTLGYQALADGELAVLEQFFESAEGSLNSFTFLDPAANLLLWSESLGNAAWVTSPLLQLTGNFADALGGTNATRVTNATGSICTIVQTLNAPAWFTYCLSVYARAAQSGSITLNRQSDSGTYAIQPGWKRLTFSGQSQGTAGTVTVGLGVPAGQSVDIFGVQLEAQPGASRYKQTFGNAGLYAAAHFAADTFGITTSAPNRHSCTLQIMAPAGF